MPSSSRFFKNNLRDVEIGEKEFRAQWSSIFSSCLSILKKKPDTSEPSVYIGRSGYALMLYRVAKLIISDPSCLPGPEFSATSLLEYALDLVQRSLKEFHPKRSFTFLEGKAGALALKVVICHGLHKDFHANSARNEILNLLPFVQQMPEGECEILYGRCGYLSAIQFIRRECNEPRFAENEVQLILRQILLHGFNYARKNPQFNLSLLYAWHQRFYLGAAHGLIGILHMFLLFCHDFENLKPELEAFGFTSLRDMLDRVLSEIQQSYTYLSQHVLAHCQQAPTTQHDILVHWCHGSPGMILLLSAFLKRFALGKAQYQSHLKALTNMANAVWSQGLLKKGLGLCHGIGGNAIALFSVSQVVDKDLWIQRGRQFLLFGWSRLDDLYRTPDHPDSLFEGLSGYVWALCDALQPSVSGFPGML